MGLREYETIYVVKPDSPDELQEKILARLEKTIADFKGVVVVKENWGKKKLSYDIAKSAKGNYVFVNYIGQGGLVAEIERSLRLDESILRFMTVKVGENVNVEARIAAAKERKIERPVEKTSDALDNDDEDME